LNEEILDNLIIMSKTTKKYKKGMHNHLKDMIMI